MSCINYSAKVVNVFLKEETKVYNLKISMNCDVSGIQKEHYKELEIPKADPLLIPDAFIIEAWNDGTIINQEIEGQVMNE